MLYSLLKWCYNMIMIKNDPETNVAKFSKAMVSAVWDLLKTNKFKDGQTLLALRKLAVKVIGQLVEFVVTQILNEKFKSKATKEQEYMFVQANYVDFKKDLQEEVAFGMSRAMSKFSGHEVDYYCDIKLFTEVINKLDC